MRGGSCLNSGLAGVPDPRTSPPARTRSRASCIRMGHGFLVPATSRGRVQTLVEPRRRALTADLTRDSQIAGCQAAPSSSVPPEPSRDTLRASVLGVRRRFPLAAQHISMGASSPKQGHRRRVLGGDLMSPVDSVVSAPLPRTAHSVLATPPLASLAAAAAPLPTARGRTAHPTA